MTPKPQDEEYTITAASDWPMLLILGGLLVGVIGGMWVDLKSTIKESRTEWRQELQRHEDKQKDESDKIWDAIKDCQGAKWGNE